MSTDSKALPLAQKRVALGVTGGIAAYKSLEVLRVLQQAGCEVRVAMTRHACYFIQPLTFRALSGSYVIVDDYAPENPDPIFFFQAEDGIRDHCVTGVQTCALPISGA